VEAFRLLIVEDNPALRQVLQDVLGHYSTITADSIQDALTKLDGDSYACALIDLGLPDGNGVDLLPAFKSHSPCGIPIILTGDGRAETIVETMRAGAYDYLMKPLDMFSLRTAVERALQHHQALRDRDDLFRLLEEERRQLQVRVDQATADIRQYATHCEIVNARLDALLRLTQVCADFYTDEGLFRGVLTEISKYVPIECLALTAPMSQEFLAALRGDTGEVRVIASRCVVQEPAEGDATAVMLETLAQCAGYDHPDIKCQIYPQAFWGRTLCNVAFLLPPDYELDGECDEFLSMCAHFLATEWQEAQLFLYTAQRASLGSMAMDISNDFIQALTAIHIASDTVAEMGVGSDAKKGLGIITENVEKIRRQLDEFRQLSQPQKGSFMTVDLADYIEQALELLAGALLNRNVKLKKEFTVKGSCILLNVSTLAWTIINLVANAVRAVNPGDAVTLKLKELPPDSIEFAIIYKGEAADGLAETGDDRLARPTPQIHPTFFLAQRTIRSCGGRLAVDQGKDGQWTLRVILPRDPMRSSQAEAVS